MNKSQGNFFSAIFNRNIQFDAIYRKYNTLFDENYKTYSILFDVLF